MPTIGKPSPTRRSLDRSGVKDIDKGRAPDLRVINYTSNKITKEFIVSEAQKMAPGLKPQSGACYRLNRWREEQLTNARRLKSKARSRLRAFLTDAASTSSLTF